MRSLVAGVEAVLPDGSIHNGLSGLKKDNRGYSLDQLLIGAEGTLGVVTAVALKLVPAIVARAVAWAGVESPAKARSICCAFSSSHAKHRGFRAGADRFAPAGAEACSWNAIAASGTHPWHVLVEATTTKPRIDIAVNWSGCLAQRFSRASSPTPCSRQVKPRRTPSGKSATPFPKPNAPKARLLLTIFRSRSRICRDFIDDAAAEVERAFPV